MILKTNNPSVQADFYIARVGACIGKPMMQAYTCNNSFAVISDNVNHDFALVFALYKAWAFKPYSNGTCQPAIRIRDCMKVIKSGSRCNVKDVDKLHLILEQVTNYEKQVVLLKEMALAYSRKITS